MTRHNKKIRELMVNKFRHNYEVTTLSLNIANTSRKQPKQSIPVEDSGKYWNGTILNIWNILNRKKWQK